MNKQHNYIIERLDSNSEAEWSDFVSSNNETSAYHSIEWKEVVESSLGHKSYCLLTREKKSRSIVGILPLFLVNGGALFGRRLVSVPAAGYAGPVAANSEIGRILIEESLVCATELSAHSLELRCIESKEECEKESPEYVMFLIDLLPDTDRVLQQMGKNIRARIRKSLTLNLEFKSGLRDTSMFFDVYSRAMRFLGSPPFSPDFFQTILDRFGESAYYCVVMHQGKPVAVDLLIEHKGTGMTVFAGSLPSSRHLPVNNFILWKEIEMLTGKGLNTFDLGRSSYNSGSYEFKRHWGGREIPVQYNTYSLQGGEGRSRNPQSPLFRTLSLLWRHMPLPVCNQVGPRIVKYLY